MKKALITGASGQDGTYLSQLLLEKGYVLWTEKFDLTDLEACKKVVSEFMPDEIYNLAAQSSVRESLLKPYETLHVNTLSIFNLLESVRTIKPDAKLFHAASSEMYAALTKMPINEHTGLCPTTPYGVSKSIGYLTVKTYRESYGLFTVNGILFNHESPLRSSNSFIKNLIAISRSISQGSDAYVEVGNSKNTRDYGYAKEYVEAMWLMLQAASPEDYVIATGKAISIEEIVMHTFNRFNIPMERMRINPELIRLPDAPEVYGDSSKAKEKLGWKCETDFLKTLDLIIENQS